MEKNKSPGGELNIPPRFTPYLQRHRIYEMFYELAVELVIHRPRDHVQFLKHALGGAALAKDKPRIILLAPPFFGLEKLAKQLATAAGVPFVPILERCYDYVECQGCETTRKPGESLPRYVSRVLRTEPLQSGGWVVAGYPRTGGEADVLRRHGVRPTHVLQFVPSATPEDTCLFSNACQFTSNEVASYMEYMRKLRGLREAFAPVLKEVDIRGLTLSDLVKACLETVRVMPSSASQGPFRVALIGPTGSGCKSQARLVARRFNLVLVDAGIEEVRSRLGECPEKMTDADGRPLIPSTRVEVVAHRLLQPDCLRQGWVLVGCPRNSTEMRMLDRIDTPPNRVLVLDVPVNECRRRLVFRRFNKFTGSEHHLDQGQLPDRELAQLAMHPDDSPMRVESRLREYSSALPGLLAYLGDSALVLHASGLSHDRVFELTSAAVLRAPPPGAPRNPDATPPCTPSPPTPTTPTTPTSLARRLQGLTPSKDGCDLGRRFMQRVLTGREDPCLNLEQRAPEGLSQDDRPCRYDLQGELRRRDTVCKKLVPDLIKTADASAPTPATKLM